MNFLELFFRRKSREKRNRLKIIFIYLHASWCFRVGRKGNPVKFRGCPRSCKVIFLPLWAGLFVRPLGNSGKVKR